MEPSPSDVLRQFDRWGRFTIGSALYGLSHQLGAMDAEQIAALGVAVCGEASGLMLPREVAVGDADAAMERLSDRMRTLAAACEEIDGD